MKGKEILKKKLPIQYYSLTEEFKEMDKEDRDIYLFLRGGLTAK
jgi:hypothetical protein